MLFVSILVMNESGRENVGGVGCVNVGGVGMSVGDKCWC